MEFKQRKLASIQKIVEISPIEGADNIVRVKVKDWYCVAKKGEFKEGDKCIYFEIDSLLPLIPEFEFLKNNGVKTIFVDGEEVFGYRLKTLKLRGQISQGLVIPLNVFDIKGEVGDDLTKQLGVYKYEAPLPIELEGLAKGMMPGNLSRTDEERIQNLGNLLIKYQGYKFVGTEKIDGTSSTFYINKGDFGVCGKNVEFLPDTDNIYSKMANKYNLKTKLESYYNRTGRNIQLQGEIAGPGIQKNFLKLGEVQFFAFNIYDIDSGKYFSFKEYMETIKELDIPHVPVLYEDFLLPGSVSELLELADKNSTVNPKSKQEGIVFKLMNEQNDPEFGRVSFKVISNRYLLKSE